jgi:hypothetical protein
MFLSQPARDRYFRLYDELESAIAGLGDDAESLSREGAAELCQRASALRHQLVADVGVAERPRTKWIMPAKTQPPHCRNSAQGVRSAANEYGSVWRQRASSRLEPGYQRRLAS